MNILIYTLGCSKNYVEAETLAAVLTQNGHQTVSSVTEADTVIIHTCSFISAARKETESVLNQFIRQKNEYTGKWPFRLIVSGCWVQHYKNQLISRYPQVDCFIGTGKLDNILSVLNHDILDTSKLIIGKPGGWIEPSSFRPVYSTSAYVRLSEGCNERCTFCIIPRLRGKFISRPEESIVTEVTRLVERGVREINLVAQNTTFYGYDLYGKFRLPALLRQLVKIPALHWIRILYTHPAYFTEELITQIAREPKICKYIDLPLQHINNRILHLMQRRVTTQAVYRLIDTLRDKIADLTLRTTFIVGFPTETVAEFTELLDFCRKVEFDKLGCFIYSREINTVAAKLTPQLSEREKKCRQAELTKVQKRIVQKLNVRHLGTQREVLVDRCTTKMNYTRSQAEAPEVDGWIKVYPTEKEIRPGEFIPVKVVGFSGYDLIAELKNK